MLAGTTENSNTPSEGYRTVRCRNLPGLLECRISEKIHVGEIVVVRSIRDGLNAIISYTPADDLCFRKRTQVSRARGLGV